MIEPPRLAAIAGMPCLHPREYAVAVHRVDLAPAGEVGIDDGAQGDHAGVVDQDIEAAELLDRGADHRLPVVFIGDVQAHENRVVANGVSHRLVFLIQVGHHHWGALACQRYGVRLSIPLAPPVMIATLPETLPMLFNNPPLSVAARAALRRQFLSARELSRCRPRAQTACG